MLSCRLEEELEIIGQVEYISHRTVVTKVLLSVVSRCVCVCVCIYIYIYIYMYIYIYIYTHISKWMHELHLISSMLFHTIISHRRKLHLFCLLVNV